MCLMVSDLAYHNNIRVLSNYMPQGICKIQTYLWFYLYLVYPFKLVLHRVFNSDYFFVRRIYFVQCAVESRSLSASSRTCDKYNSVWFFNKGIKGIKGFRWKTQ